MSEVFILGAGFSKAINGSMPLLPDLSEMVRCRLESESVQLPHSLIENADIELWLTYLSQPQPWLKEYENLENRALFLRITSLIGDVLNNSTEYVVRDDIPKWLDDLVQWWNKHQSSVITFNYDTLIERAAGMLDILTGYIYPLPLSDMSRGVVSGGFPAQDKFKLYKLHGSTNLHYSGASSFQGENLIASPVPKWGKCPSDQDKRVLEALSDKVPLIVPPTTEKVLFFQNETIRQIWNYAAEALKSATKVYCVGYSLPITDLGIQFFLQHNRPKEKVDLFVVNKESDSGRLKELKSRYDKVLGNSYNINMDYACKGAEYFVSSCLTTR